MIKWAICPLLFFKILMSNSHYLHSPRHLIVLPSLKVSTGWIELEIVSEPDVILTFRGYTPILRVRKVRTGVEYQLYISAKSLAEPLEELRKSNVGTFKGIRFRIRKESMKQMAKYEIERIDD